MAEARRGTRVWRLIWHDMGASARLTGRFRWPSAAALADQLTLPGTWAVILYRIAAALHQAGLRPLSRVLYFANVVLFGAELQPDAVVGPGLVVPHPVGTGFGGVRMGANVHLMGGVRLGQGGFEDRAADGWPTVGNDCFLFDGAKVLGPVTLGDGVVVSVAAVVLRDMPANTIVAGNPARVVKHRGEPEGREEAS